MSKSLRASVGALALLLSGVLVAAPAAADSKKRRAAAEAPDAVTYGQRDDLMRFADELSDRHRLDPAWVREKLAAARYIPSVARLIMPPPSGTPKNWAAYRARFIEPRRIAAGLAFWRANEAWLSRAEERYGVPASIVAGIVGVETLYGQHMGTYRVLDALATLAFDFPPGRKDRSAFFRDELEQLFLLAQREGADPLALKGSYAGAMGLPQFMPSSWNRYAVDFDGDGRIDLRSSSADAIGSVAHYLAEFGWSQDLPAYFTVEAPNDPAQRAVLLAPDITPSFTPEEFSAQGAELAAAAHDFDGKLALVEMQNGEAAPSYVAGTRNFYAITRYNWSSYYAMAVIELGAALERERAAR